MKKNKGFTLIELLAIIVILAIIAVITVPIILNIIENSRIGAASDSAYGYKDAVNKWYVSKLQEDSNYKLNGNYTVTDGKLNNIEIPLSGDKPTNGTLTYSNNILTGGCLTIGEYKVTFDSKGSVSSTEKGSCSSGLVCGANEYIKDGIEYYVPEDSIDDCISLFVQWGLTEQQSSDFCSGKSTLELTHNLNLSDFLYEELGQGQDGIEQVENIFPFSVETKPIQRCVAYIDGPYGYRSMGDLDVKSSRPVSSSTYLRYAITNGIVADGTIPDTCIYSEDYPQKELCLKNNEFETSVQKIKDYFGYDKNTWIGDTNDRYYSDSNQTVTCDDWGYSFGCFDSSISVRVNDLDVSTFDSMGYSCTVSNDDIARCYWQ